MKVAWIWVGGFILLVILALAAGAVFFRFPVNIQFPSSASITPTLDPSTPSFYDLLGKPYPLGPGESNTDKFGITKLKFRGIIENVQNIDNRFIVTLSVPLKASSPSIEVDLGPDSIFLIHRTTRWNDPEKLQGDFLEDHKVVTSKEASAIISQQLNRAIEFDLVTSKTLPENCTDHCALFHSEYLTYSPVNKSLAELYASHNFPSNPPRAGAVTQFTLSD